MQCMMVVGGSFSQVGHTKVSQKASQAGPCYKCPEIDSVGRGIAPEFCRGPLSVASMPTSRPIGSTS